MNKGILCSFACLLILSGNVAMASEKIRVAVYDLEASNVKKDIADSVSRDIRAELFTTGRFITTDKSTMDKLLKEQAFQQTGCTSSECAVEVGKILNVSVMATGSISMLGKMYNLTVTLTDVERGETLQIEKASCDSEEKLLPAVKGICNSIALKMPIIGKVVKVGTDNISVVVDLGSADRVEKDMRFVVNRLKEEIKDSTGKVIMKEFEDLGEIRLTDVQKEASRAIFSPKSNNSRIKVGDDVKIGEEDLKKMNSGIQAAKQTVVNMTISGASAGGGSFIDPAWRSLLLPGWGQFYNKDDFKGWVFTIAGLGAATGAVIRFLDFNNKRMAYESISDPAAPQAVFDDAYNQANEAYREFNNAARMAAIIWSLNVLDAVISYDPRKQHSSIMTPEVAPNGLYCMSNGFDSVKVGYNIKW